MSVKKLKPITPAQRFRIVNGFDAITTDKPEKSLLSPKKKTGGKIKGKMTSLHRWPIKRDTVLDFKRNKFDVPSEVNPLNMIQIDLLLLL